MSRKSLRITKLPSCTYSFSRAALFYALTFFLYLRLVPNSYIPEKNSVQPGKYLGKNHRTTIRRVEVCKKSVTYAIFFEICLHNRHEQCIFVHFGPRLTFRNLHNVFMYSLDFLKD